MTAPVEVADPTDPAAEPRPPSPAPPARPTAPASAREIATAICPYLSSTAGSWRSVSPSRDHRCQALNPPTPQPTDKQRRHCLAAEHDECSIFRAAQAARQTALAAGADPARIAAADAARRPLPRTTPVLLEPPRLLDQAARLQLDRAPGQLALVALMVIAFAIVALSRFTAPATSAAPSPSPSFVAVLPSAAATPIPTPSAEPSSEPSNEASVGPSPSFRTTYTVKKGDTLIGVAAKFKTTAAAIRKLNALQSSSLKVGQVLKIP
jgi:LysM repeat protein